MSIPPLPMQLLITTDGRTDRVAAQAGLTIGRGDGCDIVIAGETVARTHVRLENRGGNLAAVCSAPGAVLRTPDGFAEEVVFSAGVRFTIGDAEFECRAAPAPRGGDEATPARGPTDCPYCGKGAKGVTAPDEPPTGELFDRLGMPADSPLTPAGRSWRGGPLVRYRWDRGGHALPVELDAAAAWYAFFFHVAGAGAPPADHFESNPRGGLTVNAERTAAVTRGWPDYHADRDRVVPVPDGGPDDPFAPPAAGKPPKCGGCGRRVLPADAGGGEVRLLPASVGGWTVGGFHARGGMGLVLRGHDGDETTPAAVKIRSGPEGADRFKREADLLTRIDHPHVVRALGAGSDGECDYLVLEWVEGQSLKEVMTDRLGEADPFPASTAARWGRQVAEGLGAVHEHGVHRDVKPSNVLVDWRGQAKLADLGVARAAAHPGMTTTGAVAGTAAYMAPEQLAGADPDERADLYALGVTLYELLTGTRPGFGSRPASEENETVSPALDRALSRLLSPDPGGRPGTAGEAADLLSGAD